MSSCAEARLAQKVISALEKKGPDGVIKLFKKMTTDIATEIRFEDNLEKMGTLHYAALRGHFALMSRCLQETGIDPNKATQFDLSTPLHLAATHPDSELAHRMCLELIKYNASVNQLNYCGQTPLVVACEMGHREMVRALCGQAADLGLHYSEYDDLPKPSTKDWLLVEDLMRDPFLGNSALLQTCRGDDAGLVEDLVRSGADLTATNTLGNTALHVACLSYRRCQLESQRVPDVPPSGQPRLVRVLLHYGCQLDVLNANGDSPIKMVIRGVKIASQWLYSAELKVQCVLELLEVLRLLVKAGCKVESITQDSERAFPALLDVGRILTNNDSDHLQHALGSSLQLLVAAGCPVVASDLSLIRSLKPVFLAASVLERVQDQLETALPLKQQSKIYIRRTLPKPLAPSIRRLDLPRSLQDYVLLETLD